MVIKPKIFGSEEKNKIENDSYDDISLTMMGQYLL